MQAPASDSDLLIRETDPTGIAVRRLCDFAARRGSLDNRYTPSPSAQEGIIGHQWLQRRYGEDYQSEYPLRGCLDGVHLQGRADL